jgi:hypothetical protein
MSLTLLNAIVRYYRFKVLNKTLLQVPGTDFINDYMSRIDVICLFLILFITL